MSKKNQENQIDAQSIKEYENAQRIKNTPMPPLELVDMDEWWAKRAPALSQPSHIKEILKADAAGRKISGKQTVERWDWAARQFGLTFDI
jgi:hypothetical protein